jgi:hypothetical protein
MAQDTPVQLLTYMAEGPALIWAPSPRPIEENGPKVLTSQYPEAVQWAPVMTPQSYGIANGQALGLASPLLLTNILEMLPTSQSLEVTHREPVTTPQPYGVGNGSVALAAS